MSDDDAISHAKLVDEGNVSFKETLDLRKMQEQLSSLWITPTACAESCYVEADQRKLTTRLGTWFCIGEEKGET